MQPSRALSRRQFLELAASAVSVAALTGACSATRRADVGFAPPIALFDKVLRQAGLSLEDSAAFVGEMGLDGVDCAVRPNDRIEPARVREDLPRYAELLRQQRCKVLLLTTAILNPDAPHARTVLETARALGVRCYRLAFARWRSDAPVATQLAELKAVLRDVVALNRELGLCAVLQNHSPGEPGGYLGGDLNHMFELVREFPPAQLGVAFDLGHALLVHGDAWPAHFERLKPHLRVAYIKDAHRQRRFVPFGEGEFGQTDFFTRLKQMRYAAPLSLHIEFDWARDGRRDRATLAAAV
ncbi:MAG: TIM barrel protein, partial [Verrucomicrobiales bacterium]|nr:TIM barrel protein [Verrucomicrobiales bacterium]